MSRLPVPRLPAVPAVMQGALRRRLSGGWAAELERRVRGAGAGPLEVRLTPGGSPAGAIVCEPCPPEVRATALEALQTPFGRVLLVTPREWEVVRRQAPGRRLPGATLDRTANLRAAAGLFVDDLPGHLAAGDLAAARDASTSLRDLLESLGSPTRFPPIPSVDATEPELLGAALGAFGAVLGGEVAVEPGESLADAGAQPLRSADAVDAIFGSLVADLPAHSVAEMRALYLLPGPWGTRRSWWLLAVVPDDAPLRTAGRIRFRLQQHLGMLPAGPLRGATGGATRIAVVTHSAAEALLRRRLFARPLLRPAARLHRRLLAGEDVLAAALAGPELVRPDLDAELAALVDATAAAWARGATALQVTELLFGAWPAVIALLRGGSLLDPLAAAHAELAASSDPALSRVGAAAAKLPLGDPWSADLARPVALLRDLGPALVRLQEVAFEALGQGA